MASIQNKVLSALSKTLINNSHSLSNNLTKFDRIRHMIAVFKLKDILPYYDKNVEISN